MGGINCFLLVLALVEGWGNIFLLVVAALGGCTACTGVPDSSTSTGTRKAHQSTLLSI